MSSAKSYGWGSEVEEASTYSKNKLMQVAKVEQLLPELSKELPPQNQLSNFKALDIGCGDGETTHKIAKLYQIGSVVGCDVSRVMIEHATKHFAGVKEGFKLQFRVMDASKLSFNCEFDLVWSFNALHWLRLEVHKEILQGIKRALKPGGKLFLEFEAENSMQQLFDTVIECASTPKWSKNFPSKLELEITRPNKDVYKEIVQACGFSEFHIEVVEHISVHNGKAGLLSRLEGAWMNIPGIISRLDNLALRKEFAKDIADLYVSKYPPNVNDELLLENKLLVIRAVL